jgi:hypothetical protein
MEQQLASLERDTGIDNVVYGASPTRPRKLKTSTTPPKQSRTSKPKTQSSLYTFDKKTKPRTHPHRKLFVTGDEEDITPDQWLNDFTADTISVNPPTKTPPDPPNKILPINGTQVPPTPGNDTFHDQGNTPKNSPDCNATPLSPNHQAHSQISPPTTYRPSNDNDPASRNTRNTHNCPEDANIPTVDPTQHQPAQHETTTLNTPSHSTKGNNNDTVTTHPNSPHGLNTWQKTTTSTPSTTPLANTTLTNCTHTHLATNTITISRPHTNGDNHEPRRNSLNHPTETCTNTQPPHQRQQHTNTGQHHLDQKPKQNPASHNVIMEETTNSPDNHTTPMELEQHDSEDDTDNGAEHKNENTVDDLSDPEHSSGNDSDTEKQNNENKYKLQGPTRVQRKIDARERRTRNNARRTAAKTGDASPPQPHHKSYRIQIKFGTIIKQEKHTVNAMQHVSEFVKQWNMIDEDAELVNIKGDNKQWSYKKGTHPANPTQVKNCLHDFYSKDYTGNVVLNTTIELTSTTEFWTAPQKMADI